MEQVGAAENAGETAPQVDYEPPELRVLGALRELTQHEIPDYGGSELAPFRSKF